MIAWLTLKALNRGPDAYKAAAPLRAAQATLSDVDMLNTLGAVYLANDRPDDARRALEPAAGFNVPASYLIHLARAYALLRQPDNARLCLARAATLPRLRHEIAEAAEVERLIREPK
jgi:hypothetical protein